MKNKKLYIIAFFLILIVYIKFFEFKPFFDFSYKLVILVFFLLTGFVINKFFKKNGVFIKPIMFIIFSLFIAIIPAIVFRDQDLMQSIVAIAPYSYFLIFLYLHKIEINKNIIIKVILTISYFGLVLFIFQFFNHNEVFFGFVENFDVDRGLLRVVFPGEGFLFFALFYYLNKLGSNFKLKYLLFFLPFLWMLFIQVTRMYLLAFGLILVYHLLIKSQVIYRVIGILSFIVLFYFIFNTDNKVVSSIKDATTNDFEQKDDYIRLLEAEYYLFEFSTNDLTYLIGNGAFNFNSEYGKKILKLNQDYNYYLDDIGLIQGYVLFGLFFLLGYILIYIKSFKLKIPNDYMFLKYYIWMMIVMSFTTRATTNAGFGVVFVVVIYLYEKVYEENLSVKKILV